MQRGSTITFDASINPSVGHPKLIDYTATKGAIVGFARALSNQIVGEKGIRVNGMIFCVLRFSLYRADCSRIHTASRGAWSDLDSTHVMFKAN